MKKLTRMLLVNWHYYTVEWISFDNINFLTGKTGAGKSTLIDAMQIVLLGDTNGQHFFNKAANDRSRRSLKGYLRGEYGDDGGSGYLYLRNQPFSSYIACEFYDTVNKKYLTIGIVFDCNYTATDESCFFIVKDKIPDNGYLRDDVAMEIRDLKQYLRQNYKRDSFDICTTAREYRNKLTGNLGGFKPDRYFTLMKKAVSFTPIIDIEEFITEHICDSRRPPDLTGMQDNLRQYRRLEQEAEQMRARIEDLNKIRELFKLLQQEIGKRKLYRFLIDRCDLENAVNSLRDIDKKLVEASKQLDESIRKEQELIRQQEKLQNEHDSLVERRGQNDIYQQQQNLQKERARLDKQIAEYEESLQAMVNQLNIYGLNWRKAADETQDILKKAESVFDELPSALAGMRSNLPAVKEQSELLLNIRQVSQDILSAESFESFRRIGDSFRSQQTLIRNELLKEKQEAQQDLEDCEDRISDLEQNIKHFNPRIIRFRQELEQHLYNVAGRKVEVDILADLIEINDQRWVNVIEGYLHRQKQFILIESEWYEEAVSYYDINRHKHQYYDVSLIDGQKVLASNPRRLQGSLAEEIITDNREAGAYVDFLIGSVIKCDTAAELRLHERAVTDSGLLYQSYVISSINPKLWADHLIGKKSIQQQLNKLRKLLPVLREKHNEIESLTDDFANVRDIAVMSENEISDRLQLLVDSENLPDLRQKRSETVDQLAKLDLSWIIELSANIEKIKQEIGEVGVKLRATTARTGGLEQEKRELLENKKPEAQEKLLTAQQLIKDKYERGFREGEGELRFQSELSEKGNADRVSSAYRSQLGMRESAVNSREKELNNVRSLYNQNYNYTFDVTDATNERYDRQFEELSQQKLPEYKEKIEVAKKMAYEQFANQFLAEMKASINDVRTRINELNRALRDNRFGTDRFSFQITENQDYKRFYDMINDPMLMEGYSLTSQIFLDKHGAAIDELFSRIVDTGADMSNDEKQELERNIRLFTNYKTYLRFDMIITDEKDNKQRLSRTLLKKSGGETQTPFYIAMLASFAQLYHINDKKWNCSRLIIFDEAFSKMDGERIRESIQLLKQTGFQCIISAPPEKIGDIAPQVDRNIAVIKRGLSSFTRSFAAQQLVQAYAESDDLHEEL